MMKLTMLEILTRRKVPGTIRKLRLRMDKSLPGLPRNNSAIERTNQDVTYMTRAALANAGLPACFWEFASAHMCFLDNTEGWDKSAYALTHGKPYEGLRLPFGCRVRFIPANTKDSHEGIKWDAEGQQLPGKDAKHCQDYLRIRFHNLRR